MFCHFYQPPYFLVWLVLEEQHAGVQKEAADLRTSLRDVEKARLESRREVQDLHRQLKQLNGACTKVRHGLLDGWPGSLV